MPANTSVMATYRTAQNNRHHIIALGRSRCGFLHSSAVVDMQPKPIKAKNTAATPLKTASIPLGEKGVQVSGHTTKTPPKLTNKATPMLLSTTTLHPVRDSLIPI